jgi:hypothetical protein
MTRKCSKESPGSVHCVFQFSPLTSNSTLRKHLKRKHEDEYRRLHEARGWKCQLESMNEADTESTPVPEAQSLVPFTPKSLLDHLLDFIIAYDEVGTLRCLPLLY